MSATADAVSTADGDGVTGVRLTGAGVLVAAGGELKTSVRSIATDVPGAAGVLVIMDGALTCDRSTVALVPDAGGALATTGGTLTAGGRLTTAGELATAGGLAAAGGGLTTAEGLTIGGAIDVTGGLAT